MNTTPLENKNSRLSYDGKVCAVCGCNGSLRKWVFHFSYSFKARVCCACAARLTAPNVSPWLERHAIFSETGKLLGFRGAALPAAAAEKKEGKA